jgi:hypothetical protein
MILKRSSVWFIANNRLVSNALLGDDNSLVCRVSKLPNKAKQRIQI